MGATLTVARVRESKRRATRLWNKILRRYVAQSNHFRRARPPLVLWIQIPPPKGRVVYPVLA